MSTEVEPYDKHALAERKATVAECLAELKEREYTLDDKPALTENLNYYHEALKATEGELGEILKPILRDERNARGAYKPLVDALKEVKAFLSGKLGELEVQALAAQDDARALAEQAAAAGDHDAMVAALEAAEPVSQPTGSRKTPGWAFEIVDKALVPEIYKIVDESLIKKAAKAFAKSATPPSIPGIVFKRAVRVAPGGKT